MPASNDERRTIDSPPEMAAAILDHLRYSLGKPRGAAGARDVFFALCLATRDRLVDRMLATQARIADADAKQIYYLSMEFLIGRSLVNNLINLGLYDTCREALDRLGFDLEAVSAVENDAALGNGGLGRLAACFLDSMATLDLPGFGYGLHYDYGMFRQEIDGGAQREQPDGWMPEAWPLTVARPDQSCIVPLYGRIENAVDRRGEYNPMWLDWQVVIGVPYDMPIAGYGGRTANYLRLYRARASSEFEVQIFNEGDYLNAVGRKIDSENISKILYPSDNFAAGRELRLTQEYFLVACALRDIVRRYQERHSDFTRMADRVAVQLNDTHPALAVAELMRILVDEQALDWETAWDVTRATLAYTNHTLMPEALEKWPVDLLERVLPRHLQIIYEINRRFLDEVRAAFPDRPGCVARMSLIEETPVKQVRMAHLAIAGAHSVNGVSTLHTELLKHHLVPDFHALWPRRFNNKTNGVTPRRWLMAANPRLAALLDEAIGDAWRRDLDRLADLEDRQADSGFQDCFRAVKRANKDDLAAVAAEATGVRISPDSLFDVQVKRIHEYKRQLLHVMHIVHLYLRTVEDGVSPDTPRTCIFAGKAAPGYHTAKEIIKLIHAVADTVNADPRLDGCLKVVFLPDYRVSLAEKIIPAADLSEQISTAGTEASGTGNMKLALNGALTMGTLDGANIEIRDAVGPENIYIFGLTADEIADLRRRGAYDPRDVCRRSPAAARVMAALSDGRFGSPRPEPADWIARAVFDYGDPYFHLADLPLYIEAQQRAAGDFGRPADWARRAILNVARMSRFSSDRTIAEYAADIWSVDPV